MLISLVSLNETVYKMTNSKGHEGHKQKENPMSPFEKDNQMSPSEKDLETNLNAIDDVREIAKQILNVAYARCGTNKFEASPDDLIEAGRLAEIADRAHKTLMDLQIAVRQYGPYSLE